jgi:LysM repeat protein
MIDQRYVHDLDSASPQDIQPTSKLNAEIFLWRVAQACRSPSVWHQPARDAGHLDIVDPSHLYGVSAHPFGGLTGPHDSPTDGYGTDKVQVGDTLWSIAQRTLELNGLPVDDAKIIQQVDAIAQASHLADPNLIYPGETLDMPGADNSISHGVSSGAPADTNSISFAANPNSNDSLSPVIPNAASNDSALPAVPNPASGDSSSPLIPASDSSPVKGPLAGGSCDISNPDDFFFTQFYDPKWNPDGPQTSENCGPTSLAMALKHFGKAPPGGNLDDPEQLIESTRLAMTGTNTDTATSLSQIMHGAQLSGVNAEQVYGLSGVDAALAQGKMVIAAGNPAQQGAYGNTLTASQYSYYNGGHIILVVGHTSDGYIINDSLSRQGSMTVSESQLAAFLNDPEQGSNNGGIAVWDA